MERSLSKMKSDFRKGKGKQVAKAGDLISVHPEIVDDKNGSYSRNNPSLVFGTANSINPQMVLLV